MGRGAVRRAGVGATGGGAMDHARGTAAPALWRPEHPVVLEALREAEIGELHLLPDSSNYVFLAELTHAELGAGLAVYKPGRGERPLHDFPDGTLHHREVAAFELSRLLGWGLVPPTVVREGEHGPGSLQLFVAHDPTLHYFALRERSALRPQLVRIAAFDLAANNADRKAGHVLLAADDRLWAIDNALCFHRDGKLRTVIWDFAGERIDAGALRDLERVERQLRDGAPEADALAGQLSGAEREALAERLGGLIAEPALPQIFPWRCWPWPLI